MFVLLQKDEVLENGQFRSYFPFQISVADIESACAGFDNEELALYFKAKIKLDSNYKPIDILEIDKTKISECQHVYFLRTKRDVHSLFDSIEQVDHRGRLIAISTLRSDIE